MNKQFTDEFKVQAVKQVTEPGYTVASVSQRLGVSTNTNSLYYRMKKYGSGSKLCQQTSELCEL